MPQQLAVTLPALYLFCPDSQYLARLGLDLRDQPEKAAAERKKEREKDMENFKNMIQNSLKF